ncbi:MAG: hypothetical protein C3L25_10165 [Candidatus Sedimenticola endophacoides]|uniref:Uncharacterized protein n=1 Tax=Candidatus Sedimenticola endophacoides TaxID=2548426 RepID=A0A6N4DYS5_9GAMM|nr:MAG: hypothetical protein B0D89_03405 [Candidatus Sedimenticola endophacoides]PUD98979.1 MAG: hypothetical protein C3L26_10605 [Candidatus Sedimenticola endophacoides]PUE02624.1 MAG: hypothetical protein C3L25_10165 [Candidatus Sedimenticola endophacoides]PUE04124.1 MAG: hypothetical protein C3L24_03745 [Candidatus Sedimenticola endophacoides]
MLQRPFRRDTRRDWDISMQRGVMVRQCQLTGRREYRDCHQQAWVLVESDEALRRVQTEHHTIAPPLIDDH